MKYVPARIESSGHVILTGPIQGTVTLEDGTVVDVSAPVIEVDPAQADEIAHRIGERYAAEGHPDDVEADDDGNLVQRPFDYQAPKKFTAKKKG